MSGGGMRSARWLSVLLLCSCLYPAPALSEAVLLDDCEDLGGWSAIFSEGASVRILSDVGQSGSGMRLDFEFQAAGGWVNVQKPFSIPLPADYVFSFYLRGDAPRNNFEFKLIDPSGQNVWWSNWRDFDFPKGWQRVRIKKARLDFAWGPAAGSVLNHVGAIAFSIAAGRGGKGSVWIDEIRFDQRVPSDGKDQTPVASASNTLPGHDAAFVFDPDLRTSWRSEPVAGPQWLLIDLLRERDYGGLIIDWEPYDYATSYRVLVSSDGANWDPALSVTQGNGGRDYIYLPDAESRFVKLDLQESSRGQGYGIANVEVKPFEFSASINRFFEALAADAPPGSYPKYFTGKQTYWTVVGVNGDPKEALLNEEGMLEVDENGFSIEPFLYVDGRLFTWSSVQTRQELAEGYLPIPSVTWEDGTIGLTVTAFAAGEPWLSNLYARYRVSNRGDTPLQGRLFLALRPFQVNPPWQSLKRFGGATPIRDLRLDDMRAVVNGEKAVHSLTPPDAFGAAAFEQGPITDFLARGTVPAASVVEDPFGYASAAFAYNLDVPPHGEQDFLLAVPFYGLDLHQDLSAEEDAGVRFDTALAKTRQYWERLLNRVVLRLPSEQTEITRTLKSTLAYILINRDGSAIQPGSRTYGRSWIRDGSVTAAALLEMGFADEAREFIRWFASYQFPNGKIPCCVDERGADPTPEHDSHGEFIYAVAEYYRHSRDIGFLTDLWPNVRKAVDYLDRLRQQRLGEQFRSGPQRTFYGLLPESISHEGYASDPVHSYWDDFFALRGFKDAAALAGVLGNEEEARQLAALRDTFRGHLLASISMSMASHNIDYIPGAADLGDFDPTSTAIALAPCGEMASLPLPALTRTFEKYYTYFSDRLANRIDWEAFTAYEVRNITALVQLGYPGRALELLNFLLDARRPKAWNEWAEITWRDPEAPRFIGDMPHTWIGASFVRSVRSLFAYENDLDGSLVLAAGLPRAWITRPGGVSVERLPTHYGILHYTLEAEGPQALRMRLSGDLSVPPGKIVVQSTMGDPLKAVSVNGVPVTSFTAERAVISEFPAEIILEY